jgi:hypothetical protein
VQSLRALIKPAILTQAENRDAQFLFGIAA